MFVLRVSKAGLAWKLTVLVAILSGTLSFLTDPSPSATPGAPGLVPTSAPAAASSQSGVALVFEVPWGELQVPEILNVLEAHGAKATFETDPAWVQAYPDLARRIRRSGHQLVSRPYLGEPDIPALAPAGKGPDLDERARFVAQQVLELARPGATLRLPADDLSPATARALPIILERLRLKDLTTRSLRP